MLGDISSIHDLFIEECMANDLEKESCKGSLETLRSESYKDMYRMRTVLM